MRFGFNSPLARNTSWMAAGQGLRLLLQAAYFTLIARSLGTSNYGAFVGVAALIGIASPFGALGSANIMIRDVARDNTTFSASWGAALIRITLCGSILCVLILCLSHLLLPASVPLYLVFAVACSDLVGLNLIVLSAGAFQAFERLKWTSMIYVGISAARLIAALLIVSSKRHPTAAQWGGAYLCSTLAVAVAAILLACVKLGRPRLRMALSSPVLREGFYFATGLSAQTIYNDLDKTMLARLGSLEATGLYGAAYRIIEVSFSPVLALLSAAYPMFFRVGLDGVGAALAYARPLLLRAFLFSVALCVAILICARFLPMILGSQFASSAEALRWLSFILPLRTIHSFSCDILTSTGRQGLRTAIQVTVAILNALINLWAIPAYSWRGAAISSVVSDALLSIFVVSAVLTIASKKPEPNGSLSSIQVTV